MMIHQFLPLLIVLAAVIITPGCSEEGAPHVGAESSRKSSATPPPTTKVPSQESRWYSSDDVARGAKTYAQNCSACHGANAQGATDWRKRGPDGKFPAPPLNGTGHAWHHPLRGLGHQIKYGAPGGQGAMPGFADKLTDQQVLDAIAWFQNEWPDEIYAAWHNIEMRSRKGKP